MKYYYIEQVKATEVQIVYRHNLIPKKSVCYLLAQPRKKILCQ